MRRLTLQLTPQSLKPAVTTALLSLLEPIQAAFQANPEWQAIEQKAYPPPVVIKKEKKKKDKGTFHPGAKAVKDVEAQPDGSVEGKTAAKKTVDLGKDAGEALEKLKLAGEAVQK